MRRNLISSILTPTDTIDTKKTLEKGTCNHPLRTNFINFMESRTVILEIVYRVNHIGFYKYDEH